MHGDAIEMRVCLLHSPRVRRMVDTLRSDESFLRWAGLPGEGVGSAELLARAVVSSLMLVWKTARSLAPDGRFDGGTMEEIDRIGGVPGLGRAMLTVGWLEADLLGVKLPNFTEHNPAPAPPPDPDGEEYTADFLTFWESYPRKVGKGEAYRVWRKLRPSAKTLDRILLAIDRQRRSEQWRREKGQYIPHPSTWLNGRRWEDEADGPVKADEAERIAAVVKQAERRREEYPKQSPEELARIRQTLARGMGARRKIEGDRT